MNAFTSRFIFVGKVREEVKQAALNSQEPFPTTLSGLFFFFLKSFDIW